MSTLQNTYLDAEVAAAFADERLLANMARFEAALARASADAGLVPKPEAEAIAKACAAARFDLAAIAADTRRSGTLAIPFVKSLTAQAGRWTHFGATSQDVVDTGVVLCAKEASSRIASLALRAGNAAAALAKDHGGTAMASRTLLQPAIPVPFGWKAAVWLSMLARSLASFRAAAREASVLQLGGAGGTLSAFGGKGDAIAAFMAAELGLATAPITWHTARDAFARLGAEAAILAGCAGKIARDVSLMMQPEIGEALEPEGEGKGGSSSMPHKRNPVGCLAALEAAQRAPGLAATLLAQLTPEHERGLGQWQSQWSTLRELLGSTAAGLAAMAEVLEGLKVDAAAMQANLDRTRDLVYSEAVSVRLAASLGKAAAHALTEKLCVEAVRSGRTLREALAQDAEASKIVPEAERAKLFDPKAAFGSAPAMIERALLLWQFQSK